MTIGIFSILRESQDLEESFNEKEIFADIAASDYYWVYVDELSE
jgi:hypothetical protein